MAICNRKGSFFLIHTHHNCTLCASSENVIKIPSPNIIVSGKDQNQKAIIQMERIGLRVATKKDKLLVVAFDYALDKDQHIELKREDRRKNNKSNS